MVSNTGHGRLPVLDVDPVNSISTRRCLVTRLHVPRLKVPLSRRLIPLTDQTGDFGDTGASGDPDITLPVGTFRGLTEVPERR